MSKTVDNVLVDSLADVLGVHNLLDAVLIRLDTEQAEEILQDILQENGLDWSGLERSGLHEQ